MTREQADLHDVLGAVVAAVRLGLPRVALRQTPRAFPPRHRPLFAHLPPRPPLLFSPLPSSLQRTEKWVRFIKSLSKRHPPTNPQITATQGRDRRRRAHRSTSPLTPLRAECVRSRDSCFYSSPLLKSKQRVMGKATIPNGPHSYPARLA